MKHQEKLAFPTRDGFIFLRIDDISYVKSDDIYTYIHNGSSKHFSTQSLKKIIDKLPKEHFIRCHRSYIVNTSKVHRLIKSANYRLIMENADEIPVARGKKEEVMKRMTS